MDGSDSKPLPMTLTRGGLLDGKRQRRREVRCTGLLQTFVLPRHEFLPTPEQFLQGRGVLNTTDDDGRERDQEKGLATWGRKEEARTSF
jgi:hypothetical protein